MKEDSQVSLFDVLSSPPSPALSHPSVNSPGTVMDTSHEVPAWAKTLPDVSTDLYKRYDKATKADLTPVEFDPSNQCAEFSSKHGYYFTTLDSCMSSNGKPCAGGFPCKHMYRLAMTLGIVPGKYKDDPSKIKWVRNGVPFDSAVQRLETISSDAQQFLLSCILDLRNGSMLPSDSPANFVAEMSDAKILIHIDEPEGHRLHPDLDMSSYKLYRYLHRKYDSDCWFVDNFGTVLVPANAQAVFSPNGGLLSIYFPDDDVTRMLNAFNCNRCTAFKLSEHTND